MFQTNQGPSFPAHQFLLSGTSAPDSKTAPLYADFAMDNPTTGSDDAGCAASSGSLETLISPTGDTSEQTYPCMPAAIATRIPAPRRSASRGNAHAMRPASLSTRVPLGILTVTEDSPPGRGSPFSVAALLWLVFLPDSGGRCRIAAKA